MSKRAADLLIEDIWEAIEKIERYTKGMTRESFEEDEKTADAVVRNLEIIGEAVTACQPISNRNIPRSNGPRSLDYVTALCTNISALTWVLSGRLFKVICCCSGEN